MVVHVGVVVVAVGLAAATSFIHRGELLLRPGQTATYYGHEVTFVGQRTVTTPSHTALEAALRVDHGMFFPAISQFDGNSQAVGTPAIDSSWRGDLYLTIDSIPGNGSTWTFGVVEQPLVMWLWIGAGLVALGSVLAAIPGRRRRPTDPISTPVAGVAPATRDDGAEAGTEAVTNGDGTQHPTPAPLEPVAVGPRAADSDGP
jgi:cytochrome c-type biogenesis protein CcmF